MTFYRYPSVSKCERCTRRVPTKTQQARQLNMGKGWLITRHGVFCQMHWPDWGQAYVDRYHERRLERAREEMERQLDRAVGEFGVAPAPPPLAGWED